MLSLSLLGGFGKRVVFYNTKKHKMPVGAFKRALTRFMCFMPPPLAARLSNRVKGRLMRFKLILPAQGTPSLCFGFSQGQCLFSLLFLFGFS